MRPQNSSNTFVFGGVMERPKAIFRQQSQQGVEILLWQLGTKSILFAGLSPGHVTFFHVYPEQILTTA